MLRAGELAGSGICERVEGGPLEWAIGMVCRLTGADRRMIVAAGETLQHLPAVRRLWSDGLLTWGQVRAIALAVRRLPLAGRALLDERIATSHEAFGGIDAFDPDHFVEAVDRAVLELKDPRNLERRERQGQQSNFLALQPSTDGRVRGYFDYDVVNGAIVVNGLDAASPRPEASDPHREPDEPTSRGRQYAEGLVEMARDYLAGHDGDNGAIRRRRPARPLFIAHVDVADVTRAEGATLELNVRGRLARITCATLDALSRDADVRAVLFDGARPLAVTKKLRGDKLAPDIRLAVRARDMGDRFPGSQEPLGHTEVHHFRHREHGGDNDVDNLGSFTKRIHLGRIHKHGWRITIDPPTGMITARRKDRAWRSLPRSTGLARPPDSRPAATAPAPDRRTRRNDIAEPLPF